jgi:hypothetical protein
VDTLAVASPETIAAEMIRVAPSFVITDMMGEPFREDRAIASLFRVARAPLLFLRK